jgi:hypothetical protein
MTCIRAETSRSSLTASVVSDVVGLPGVNVLIAMVRDEAMDGAADVHWPRHVWLRVARVPERGDRNTSQYNSKISHEMTRSHAADPTLGVAKPVAVKTYFVRNIGNCSQFYMAI